MTTTSEDFTRLQEYNGKDAANTIGLLEELLPQLDEHSSMVYNQHLALQGPAMSMMLRGIRVNQYEISKQKVRLENEMDQLRFNLNYLSEALIGTKININSVPQVGDLLVRLGVDPVKKYNPQKGESSITWERDALEKIGARDELIYPIVDTILQFRDRKKTHQVLSTGVRNGRIYTSFNTAGTDTFRWSSSESAFWDGTNTQNITEDLRAIFISDPGWKFFNIDLSTGDSRIVALDLFQRLGDSRYLDACLGGDLHTNVAKMVWPDLGWTGDPEADRELAEQYFYRHYSYRFMCKKFGHGTNYLGTVATLATQTKTPRHLVEVFQPLYYASFGIDHWQRDVIHDLQLNKHLFNIYGYRRWFHGRVNDSRTWREAVAYLGQSGTAITLNTALLRVFREVPSVQLFGQGHDSLQGQFREEHEEDFLKVLECFNNPISVTYKPKPGSNASSRLGGITRTHTIPIDAHIGWNWGKHSDKNPDGLKTWGGIGSDKRKTRTYDPSASFLDRKLS